MKEFYTIRELSDKYSVSTRTIERHLKALILKEKNSILIPKDVAKLLELRHKYDKYSDTSTTNKNELSEQVKNIDVEYDIIEGFSAEEYQEFKKRLIEYPLLKEQLEYHKKASESHQRQMEHILRTLEQRNYIEAKEKKIDQ